MKTSTELALDLARVQGAVAGLRAALHTTMAVHGAHDVAVQLVRDALLVAQRKHDAAHAAWLDSIATKEARRVAV